MILKAVPKTNQATSQTWILTFESNFPTLISKLMKLDTNCSEHVSNFRKLFSEVTSQLPKNNFRNLEPTLERKLWSFHVNLYCQRDFKHWIIASTSDNTPLSPCPLPYCFFFKSASPRPPTALWLGEGFQNLWRQMKIKLFVLTVRPLRTSCFATDHLPYCYFWSVGPHCSTLAKVVL